MKTGIVFEELYMWHESGGLSYGSSVIQPLEGWEDPETKRRFMNLLSISGILDNEDPSLRLTPIKARAATRDEIVRFHTERYHDYIVEESKKVKGGDGGELAQFGYGGYKIAALSAGGVLAAVEAVCDNSRGIDNVYCLVRPPGHHAIADRGMGFCIFNNIALAALHAREKLGVRRIAIVDYDVHHGNGTQDAFYHDPDTLFISLHQDNNYPQGNSGAIDQIGGPTALGSTINVPLPPGSGKGAYEYAFERVVTPALHRFQPDLILVSSGFDASYADPLGSMMLYSEVFRTMAKQLVEAATSLCGGKIVFAHEGGYSKDYVPFCGLAVVEAISGIRTDINDPHADEARDWGYQSLQAHQQALIDKAAALHGLNSSAESGEGNMSDAEIAGQIKALLLCVGDEERRTAILNQLLLDIECDHYIDLNVYDNI